MHATLFLALALSAPALKDPPKKAPTVVGEWEVESITSGGRSTPTAPRIKVDFIDKDLGYELRSADPIPFDAEYTRDLGYGAVKFLASAEAAEHGAIISFVGGKLKPLPFEDMIDPKTQRMRPRKVNVDSESFLCAKRYMVRLEPGDLADGDRLKKLAGLTNLSPEAFQERFGPVADM